MVYALPVVAVSVLFYLPKFFETSVTSDGDGGGGATHKLDVRDLRKDGAYIFWYVNLANLLVTGLGPLLALSLLNARIYLVLKRRWKGPLWATTTTTNMNAGDGGGGGRRESEVSIAFNSAKMTRRKSGVRTNVQQAVVLFYIVAAFFVANVLRVCINAGEVAFAGRIQSRINARCKGSNC